MNEEEKIVVLHCLDTKERPVHRYKVFASEVKFTFVEAMTVVGLSIQIDDTTIYEETFDTSYEVSSDGGDVTLNLTHLEL